MESTLSMPSGQIFASVADFLGYPRGEAYGEPEPSKQQAIAIKNIIASGTRQFYYPPPIQGSDVTTDWSFLHPTASVLFAQGAKSVTLPDDFGGLEGRVTIAPSTTLVWWELEVRNEGAVRAMYAQFPAMVSRPIMTALAPIKGTTGTAGQRFEMLVFPKADQDYTLQFQYYVLPDAASMAFPYLYGGAAHTETILASCLAMAEQLRDNMAGVHTMRFQERLIASIGMDRKNKAQSLGYNGDGSDRMNRQTPAFWHFGDRVLVNGVLYTR